MDATIDSPEGSEDGMLPVSVDTLSIDGVAPDVGDTVELKVKGSVTKVLNGMAYVKPERVNDQEISGNSEPDLREMSAMADQQGAY